MIQFENGNLTYTLNGVKVSYGINDGQKYADLDTVRSDQIEAERENTEALGVYARQLADAKGQDLAGHPPANAPVKPLKKVVADNAVVIGGVAKFDMVPFDPPLEDFVPRAEPVSGGIAAPGAGPGESGDPNVKMRNQITAIYNKIVLGLGN